MQHCGVETISQNIALLCADQKLGTSYRIMHDATTRHSGIRAFKPGCYACIVKPPNRHRTTHPSGNEQSAVWRQKGAPDTTRQIERVELYL